jgi:hypothetical protein
MTRPEAVRRKHHGFSGKQFVAHSYINFSDLHWNEMNW